MFYRQPKDGVFLSIVEIMILSAALSIDAFGIGVSCAFRGIKMPLLSKAVICLVLIAVTEVASLIGGITGNYLSETAAKTIGATLLIILGMYIAFCAFFDEKGRKIVKEEKNSAVGIAVKVLHDPSAGDADRSGDVDIKEALCIGAALSADCFSAGISAGIDGNVGLMPIFCGIFHLLFLCFGEIIGKYLDGLCNIKQIWVSLFSALILILIGIGRLL